MSAIGDITSAQPRKRLALRDASLYITGHASVILGLGVVAIAGGRYVPPGLDEFMGRVVGLTLVALGLYVVVGLVRHRGSFEMQSRGTLLVSVFRKLRPEPVVVIEHDHEHGHDSDAMHSHDHIDLSPPSGAVKTQHQHTHVHVGTMPDAPAPIGPRAAFGIGTLHGVGAETPTQVLILVAASQAGGVAAGVVVLVTFVVGLMITNSALAVAGAFGMGALTKHNRLRIGLSCVVAVFSLGLGADLLFGGSGLPGLFG